MLLVWLWCDVMSERRRRPLALVGYNNEWRHTSTSSLVVTNSFVVHFRWCCPLNIGLIATLILLHSGGSRGGARDHMPTPKLMTCLKKSCESCCRRDSVLKFRSCRARCIHYSPPGKIMSLQCPLLQELQHLWLSHSQPGMSDWAGMEVWIWTYYSVETSTQLMHKILTKSHHINW